MRRALTLAFSLILCLLILAIWTRSYWITDSFHWGTAKADRQFCSTGGRLIYTDAHWPNGRAPYPFTHRRAPRTTPTWLEDPTHTDGFRLAGFEYSAQVFPQTVPPVWFFIPPFRMTAIPYWAPFALVALHPVARFARRSRRLGRKRRGLCIHCGYDLRASGVTCPECGALTAGQVLS
jgi:hypothetical protein